MRQWVIGTIVIVSGGLTACGGSSGPSTPSPSVVPLRTVPTCAASVQVPTDAVRVTPSATLPPTAVVPVGEAVSFPVPAGARVGLIGAAQAGEDAEVCSPANAVAGTTTYVAESAGYLRVGVQTGKASPGRLFVKVTS